MWTPKNTPMPVIKPRMFGRKNIFDVYTEALWLVTYFEGYVLEKSNQERQQRGWKLQDTVGDHRLEPWLENAVELLGGRDAPPLSEVCSVIDWLFTERFGFLPFVVFNEHTGRPDSGSRKVTNLRKIADYYPQILEAMRKGIYPPEDLGDDGPRRPGVNYGYADDFGEELESQVTELVRIFDEFRLNKSDDFNRWAWAKTFRIMLHHDERSFEDMKLVITNLRPLERHIDVNRYHDVYWLRQEWDHIFDKVTGLLEAYRKRAEREKAEPASAPAPEPPGRSSWDWEDAPRYRRDDGGAQTSNMATNMEERRRRYTARRTR